MSTIEFLSAVVSPLSWANDVLEDLGADIPLETCLTDAADACYHGGWKVTEAKLSAALHLGISAWRSAG